MTKATVSKMKRIKTLGFVLLITVWIFLTFLCYHKVIVFDNTTVSGAMLSGFILLTSILSIIRMLKIVYDGSYSALTDEND
jgi:hypothetical protein